MISTRTCHCKVRTKHQEGHLSLAHKLLATRHEAKQLVCPSYSCQNSEEQDGKNLPSTYTHTLVTLGTLGPRPLYFSC